MTSFLVESYAPPATAIAELGSRAARAAAGSPVRYVRTILVPTDEMCWHLFEAPSADAVGRAVARAGLSPARIVEARTWCAGDRDRVR